MKSLDEINQSLAKTEEELARLNSLRTKLLARITELQQEKALSSDNPSFPQQSVILASVTSQSTQESKIALFRSLFRGREDVYAKRFENPRTGKKGYQPVFRIEWDSGPFEKQKIRREDREYLPVTEEVFRNHLLGANPQDKSKHDFTMGIYPMLPDETCWFLAADFDKATWQEDVAAFLETCRLFNVPAALERSRSGNGGHIWIFFSEPIPAAMARKMGSFLLTRTMEQRPEIGLDSYDRFFPSQDTLPKGGFGNLIALPLQKRPRENGNTLFLDENLFPYQDQWAFLSSVRRMSRSEVQMCIRHGGKTRRTFSNPFPSYR